MPTEMSANSANCASKIIWILAVTRDIIHADFLNELQDYYLTAIPPDSENAAEDVVILTWKG